MPMTAFQRLKAIAGVDRQGQTLHPQNRLTEEVPYGQRAQVLALFSSGERKAFSRAASAPDAGAWLKARPNLSQFAKTEGQWELAVKLRPFVPRLQQPPLYVVCLGQAVTSWATTRSRPHSSGSYGKPNELCASSRTNRHTLVHDHCTCASLQHP